MTSLTIYKSPTVSCIACKKELSSRGIFSHFMAVHTEKGAAHIKKAGKLGADKTHIIQQNNALELRITYNENPSYCIICNNVLDYKHRKAKFCGSSCAATHNMKIRSESGWKLSIESIAKISKATKIFNDSKPKYTKISQCKVCQKFFPGTNKTCSEKCRKIIWSNTATNNPKMGGNKNTRAYGWYESKYAGKVWLESSYEYKVAKILDENNINWIRPTYMKYGDKKYFADFYLPEYNVYLDPKNDHLIKTDTDKIRQAALENNVTIHILNKTQLSWDSIHKLLGVRLELT